MCQHVQVRIKAGKRISCKKAQKKNREKTFKKGKKKTEFEERPFQKRKKRPKNEQIKSTYTNLNVHAGSQEAESTEKQETMRVYQELQGCGRPSVSKLALLLCLLPAVADASSGRVGSLDNFSCDLPTGKLGNYTRFKSWEPQVFRAPLGWGVADGSPCSADGSSPTAAFAIGGWPTWMQKNFDAWYEFGVVCGSSISMMTSFVYHVISKPFWPWNSDDPICNWTWLIFFGFCVNGGCNWCFQFLSEFTWRDWSIFVCLLGWAFLPTHVPGLGDDPFVNLGWCISIFASGFLLDTHPRSVHDPAEKQKGLKKKKRKKRPGRKLSWFGKRVLLCTKVGSVRHSVRLASYRLRFRSKVLHLRRPGVTLRVLRSATLRYGIQTPWFYPGPWPDSINTQTQNSLYHDKHSLITRKKRIQQLITAGLDGGGGGGAAASNRRRNEQSSLASALETFLSSWMTDHNSNQTGKGSEKGKNGIGKGLGKNKAKDPDTETWHSAPQSHHSKGNKSDGQLARQLIATLKQCLNRGDSDQTVAQTILSSLKRNSSEEHDPSAHRKVILDQNQSKTKRGKGIGNAKEPQGVWAGAHVTALRPSEWTSPPRLISFQKYKKGIEDNTLPQFNMIEICSFDEFQQFTTLRQAFEDSTPVTALLVGNAWCLEGSTQTRKTLFRGKHGPTVETVHVKTFGEASKCPWNAVVTKIQKSSLPSVTKVTLRITAPWSYRMFFVPEDADDSPSQVIASAARQAETQVSALTGGRWSKQCHGSKTQLLGHLRVSSKTAEKLTALSGTQGIFFTILQNEPQNGRSPVFWFPKETDESPETYFRRCSALATDRKQPLILRAGGGSDLGCPLQASDKQEAKAKIVDLWGAPKEWDESEICSLLTSLQWSDLQVLSRKRIRGQWSWRVRGKPHNSSKDQGSWVYEIDDDIPWTLEILLAPPKVPKVSFEHVVAPRKRFGEITLEDFSGQSVNRRGRSTKGKGKDTQGDSRPRSRSPKGRRKTLNRNKPKALRPQKGMRLTPSRRMLL